MVGHLIGAARYLDGALGRDEAIRDLPLAEHVAFTQPFIDTQRSASPAEATAAFAEAFSGARRARPSLDGEGLTTITQYYGFEVPRADGARRRELRAVGPRRRHPPGRGPRAVESRAGDELSAMCRLAGGVLPFTLAYVGTPHPGRSARLVLTGAGGGTYVVSTAEEPPAPGDEDALVVIPALGFCRIAGRHLDVDEVDLDIEGDEAFARDMLSSARVLAS